MIPKIKNNFIEFNTSIEEGSNGGAYVRFPYDIRKEFGKGRLKVVATFDGLPYTGSIVNMGITNSDGTVCYIIGILKETRVKLNKQIGDNVKVTIVVIDE